MHGCQANKRATCGLPVVLGLCPKMKYHPLCGWIFIISKRRKEAKKHGNIFNFNSRGINSSSDISGHTDKKIKEANDTSVFKGMRKGI